MCTDPRQAYKAADFLNQLINNDIGSATNVAKDLINSMVGNEDGLKVVGLMFACLNIYESALRRSFKRFSAISKTVLKTRNRYLNYWLI